MRRPWLGLMVLAACASPPSAGETGFFPDTSASATTAVFDPTRGDETATEGDEEPDPLCEQPDESIDAMVSIERSEWPATEAGASDVVVDIEAPCTVAQVDAASGEVVTTLACDDEGTERTLRIAIPEAEDPVSWSVGDVVTIAYHYDETEGEAIWRHDLSMRRADDDAFLLGWMDQDTVEAETFAPLVVTVDEDHCGFDALQFGTWPMQVEIDSQRGVVLALVDRQRGVVVPPTGDGMLTVDIGEAGIGDAYCCHAHRHLRMLIRRTMRS